MKRMIIAIACICSLVLWSCNQKEEKSPYLYYDLDVVIVDMGGDSPKPNKHTHDGKYFYVMSLRDTTMYAEFTRDNFWRLMTDSVYYNHRVGDTLRFKYIRKSRFFKVTR